MNRADRDAQARGSVGRDVQQSAIYAAEQRAGVVEFRSPCRVLPGSHPFPLIVTGRFSGLEWSRVYPFDHAAP